MRAIAATRPAIPAPKSSPTLGQKLLALAVTRGSYASSGEMTWPPKKILVIRFNRLGELVCTLPLYRTLQANWPGARIDWLLSGQNAVLAPYLKTKGRHFVHTRGRVRYWLPFSLIKQLQAEKYDLSFAVKGGYDSLLAWVSLAVNARRRVGFLGREARRFDFAYTDPVSLTPSHIHQVEKCLALAQPFSFPRRSDDISLEVPPSAGKRVKELLRTWGLNEGQPFAVFQLSSTKRPFCLWPMQHYVELGRKLLSAGVPVYANALPEERGILEQLCTELGPRTRPACFSDMGEYLGFLASARVVVGADGGGIHLAAAVGTPTCAFYAESTPVKWKPWGDDHIQFHTHNRNVREITPLRVWESIKKAGWLKRDH